MICFKIESWSYHAARFVDPSEQGTLRYLVHNNCKTIAFMFNRDSCRGISVQLTPGFAWYFFIIRASVPSYE